MSFSRNIAFCSVFQLQLNKSIRVTPQTAIYPKPIPHVYLNPKSPPPVFFFWGGGGGGLFGRVGWGGVNACEAVGKRVWRRRVNGRTRYGGFRGMQSFGTGGIGVWGRRGKSGKWAWKLSTKNWLYWKQKQTRLLRIRAKPWMFRLPLRLNEH